jgi:hypothetical protein
VLAVARQRLADAERNEASGEATSAATLISARNHRAPLARAELDAARKDR